MPEILKTIADFANLATDHMLVAMVVALCAGVIRGFSGFALSAIVMASLSPFIAPIELIPICFGLEVIASLMMGYSGAKQADWTIVRGLVIGSLIGLPIGLLFLTNIDASLSKTITLWLILLLTCLLLFKIKARFLATNIGLYASGLAAGIVTGTAGVGGLVVALYVLARNTVAKQMRASMIAFLMISEISTAVYYFIYEMFTIDVLKRVIVMGPLVLLGIWIGTALFNPRFEPYYKPLCLLILIGLCINGLTR